MRAGGGTKLKSAIEERDEFLWYLVEGTSNHAASTEAGRAMMLEAAETGMSQKHHKCIKATLRDIHPNNTSAK